MRELSQSPVGRLSNFESILGVSFFNLVMRGLLDIA